MTALVAAYASEAALIGAIDRLRDAGLTGIETYSPMAMEPDERAGRGSPIGALALIGGVLGAGFLFFLESLATATSWGYPIDIGGRPAFSWPAYVPIAVAAGLLCAGGSAVVGFLTAAGAGRLWDPLDEFDALRGASRDRWIVHVNTGDATLVHRARAVLETMGPVAMRTMSSELEEVPA